jgi:hypothetical protein
LRRSALIYRISAECRLGVRALAIVEGGNDLTAGTKVPGAA